MRVKILLQIDLADGRADGPGHKTVVIHLFANLASLIRRDLSDIYAIHTTDLQTAQAVALHGQDLAVNALVRLVRKGKQLDLFHMGSSFPF